MTKSRFLLDVRPRAADAPGHRDLQLDTGRLMRGLRGEPCLDRLCRKMGTTRGEVLKAFTPGAYVDPGTGKVSINAGYDPGFDEGVTARMLRKAGWTYATLFASWETMLSRLPTA